MHHSGEHAFKAMSQMFGWAKRPFIERMHEIDAKVPITFIYGDKTWMDNTMGDKAREHFKGKIDVVLVSEAGHHVYADNHDEFNAAVVDAVTSTPPRQ